MSSRSDQSRQRKRQRVRASYLWAGIMTICALAALFAAIWVVMTVYEKIAGDSTEWALGASEEETTELVIEMEDVYGWITDDSGSRYREADGSFAVDSWKIWEGDLYYLKDDGYMATEDMSMDGQVFFFEEDGALTDIQLDTGWIGLTGDDNLQDLDSLVKGNGFWSYLSSDTRYAGIFKPICYRKTTETKEQVLGGESDPEISTKNSLQIHDGYLYFLPQVTTQTLSSLSQEEQELCNKLFRIRPGDPQKELLAEDATGYLVLEDGRIYYASGGVIKEAGTGTFYPIGEEKYHIQVRDGACYLIDAMGEIVTGDEQGIRSIGHRVYTIDTDGKIMDVRPTEQRYGDILFTLEADPQDGEKKVLYKEKKGGQKTIAVRAPYGIDSFSIVDNKLYYSAVVEKSESGVNYSKIFWMDPDGMDTEEISERFKGDIYCLYYYGGKGKLYGEYAPSSGSSCYGQIAVIDLDGTVNVIDDNTSRSTSGQDSDEWLTLLMVDGNTITTSLRTCVYAEGGWPWKVSSEKPYQFSDVLQDKIASGLGKVASAGNGGGASVESDPGLEGTSGASSAEETSQSSSEGAEDQSSAAQGSAEGSTAQSPTQPAATQAPAQTAASQEPAGSSTRPPAQPSAQAPTQSSAQAPTQSATQPATQPSGAADSPADPITAPPGGGSADVIPTIEPNPDSAVGVGGGQAPDGVLFVGPDGSP